MTEKSNKEYFFSTPLHDDTSHYTYFTSGRQCGKSYLQSLQKNTSDYLGTSPSFAIVDEAGLGYHTTKIKKGELGELSKIQEELDELVDAEKQDCYILKLAELADLYGAIELYLANYFPDVTMYDLEQMSNLTRKAFKDGKR